MRILLVALNAGKGDIDGNLARHLVMLEEARLQGCTTWRCFPSSTHWLRRPAPAPRAFVDHRHAEPVRRLFRGNRASWRSRGLRHGRARG